MKHILISLKYWVYNFFNDIMSLRDEDFSLYGYFQR